MMKTFRLCFRLRKEPVIDLLKIVNKHLSTLYNRDELSSRLLVIYLVFLYLLHSQGFKGYRETKRTLPIIPVKT